MADLFPIAKVIVEIGLDREFDYLIPEEFRGRIRLGMMVEIPFGRSVTRGYVVGFAGNSTLPGLKALKGLIGDEPMVSPKLLELARWLARYYGVAFEHVVRSVLPRAVRRTTSGFQQTLFITPQPSSRDPAILSALKIRWPKQSALLDKVVSTGGMPLQDALNESRTTTSVAHSLEKKGLVLIAPQVMDRNPLAAVTWVPTAPLSLMPAQAEALSAICSAMDRPKASTFLLHGVTGSGKTEVYLQAIARCREKGHSAIVLVPEIALTPQMIERFQSRFNEPLAVLHSHLSAGERHDMWYRIRDGRAKIVIGARSAVFAPVKDLGLLIVDEEHENSYKQEETPRYHARDVAVMRGHLENCTVVLGSATPSLETHHNVSLGKYRLMEMPYRVDHRQMPVVRVVDMRLDAESTGRVNAFSSDLLEAMRLRLSRAEQIILFLNRRGYATSLLCPKCGHVAQCPHCSVAYTYHRHTEELRCHICGGMSSVPKVCPACKDPAFRYAGIGTQKVEELIRKIFPQAVVQRMDADMTTGKGSHARILGDFRSGKIDILVGTQMIAKGLDFPNVTLIGVVCADTTLHMPDFRAGERTFQLLTQVAGRAGRGDIPGEVIVQTYTPFHPAVQAARRLDLKGFCDQELEFRKELSYPPYSHLSCLTIRGPVEEKVKFTAEALHRALVPMLPKGIIISEVAPAPLARAKGMYRYQLILRGKGAQNMNAAVRKVLDDFRWPANTTYALDVDALSLL